MKYLISFTKAVDQKSIISLSKINNLRDILYFILTHFNMKYKIIHKNNNNTN